MTIVDSFSRVAASSWGTADSGQAWTASGGAASDYSVSGGLGRMSMGSLAVARETRMAAVSVRNVDFTVSHLGASVNPTGDNFEQGVLARYVDANNYVDFRVFRTPTNVTCAVRQVVAGVATTSSFPTVSGVNGASDLSFRFQAIGSTIRGKAWKRGDAEPDSWTITMSTTHTSAGQIGFRGLLGAAVSNTLPVVLTFDGMSVETDGFATLTYEIPYPEPQDRFCDGYLFTQRLAEAVDALLDDFDYDLEFVQNPMYALILANEPYELDALDLMPFDSVSLDTAGLVDLARSNTTIFFDGDPEREGRWMAGIYFTHEFGGAAGTRSVLQQLVAGETGTLAGTDSIAIQNGRDNGGPDRPQSAIGSVRVSSPATGGGFSANQAVVGGAGSVTSIRQEMFAWRFSD